MRFRSVDMPVLRQKHVARVYLFLFLLFSPGISAEQRFAGKLSQCAIPGYENEALCGDLEVWENRRMEQGRKIPIHVVVLPSRSDKPAPDPILFFEGGPGNTGTEAVAEIGGLLDQLRNDRDIVFFDQRGTGKSNALNCTMPGSDEDPQGYLRELFPLELLRPCLAELQQKADLRYYGTLQAVEDVEEVRQWLGYERVNLFGISYGTLAAMVYLRQYDAHVRSIALIGVAPVNSRAPLRFAEYAQTSLDRVLDQCASDLDCRTAFPELREDFRKVMKRFQEGPVMTSLADRKSATVSLQRSVFNAALRSMLYSADDYIKVPLYIHLAATGDYSPIARHAMDYMKSVNRSSVGAYLSVTCPEDTLRIDPGEVANAVAGTFMGDERVRQQMEVCTLWPRGGVSDDYWRAVKSAVPALILSGFMDAATPPEEAAEVARQFPNSLHVVIQDAAHGPFGLQNESCAWDLLGEFIKNGTPYNLDTTCIRTMRRKPFVTQQ